MAMRFRCAKFLFVPPSGGPPSSVGGSGPGRPRTQDRLFVAVYNGADCNANHELLLAHTCGPLFHGHWLLGNAWPRRSNIS